MTVVFLHPIGLNGDCWQFLDGQPFADAVRYNLLWHGGRGKPEERLTLETMAQDVASNVAGDLDLIGLSMGGAVAQRVALLHPDRVRSLMLAASGATGNRDVQLDRARDVEQLGMSGILDVTLRRWFSSQALASGEDPGVLYARDALLGGSVESFAASWRALADNEVLEQLSQLEMPVTVLHPAEDAAGTLESKQQMVARLPRGRLKVTAGPHMVQLECPDVFGPAVVEHLEWVNASVC